MRVNTTMSVGAPAGPHLAAIESGGRPLEGRRLHAHGLMVGGYSVRLGEGARSAPTSIALKASPGVTLDRTALVIAPGESAATFAAAIGPGTSGPCSITATSDAGPSLTASFTAVALKRIELNDGAPLPTTTFPTASMALRVRLTGSADYNDGLTLEGSRGLTLDRASVAMMRDTPIQPEVRRDGGTGCRRRSDDSRDQPQDADRGDDHD